jgi:hypothetical protein
MARIKGDKMTLPPDDLQDALERSVEVQKNLQMYFENEGLTPEQALCVMALFSRHLLDSKMCSKRIKELFFELIRNE